MTAMFSGHVIGILKEYMQDLVEQVPIRRAFPDSQRKMSEFVDFHGSGTAFTV